MSMSRQQRRELERKQRKAERREMKTTPATATGPRTDEGKAISAGNALRHGLTASRTVLPWENQADYDHLLTQLMAEHDPQTAIETIYVNEMAENWWRLQRARNSEHDSILEAKKLQLTNASEEQFKAWDRNHSLIRRYLTAHERGFHRAHNMLRKLQKERKAIDSQSAEAQPAPEQFVSQKTPVALTAPATSEFVSQNEPVSALFDLHLTPHLLDLLEQDAA